MALAPEHPLQRNLAVKTRRQELEPSPTVQHIIITVEKTYTIVELGVVPPLEVTLEAMHETSPSDCPTYPFKEWTQHDRCGLEFTLPAVLPPLPPSIKFGKMNGEQEKTEMIRCITAHQLRGKYHVASPPGDIYRPIQGWWILVTLDETTTLSPIKQLMCLESLRTVLEADDTLCFHLADLYRGEFLSQHWFQLKAIVFCRQADIHVLDQQTLTPKNQ